MAVTFQTYLVGALSLASLVGYIILCSTLRYRRRDEIEQRYESKAESTIGCNRLDVKASPLTRMTDNDAFVILSDLSQLEFPTMYAKAMQLALFSTYGIPSVTKLLTATGQLSTAAHVGKRYADTGVIMAEIYENPPTSKRALDSLTRLNYIHQHYIKNHKISNDDMIFTLMTIMVLPVQFINRHEWRKLTEVEVCAFGVFYLSLGNAMEIDFSPFPNNGQWQDGTHFFREASDWLTAYTSRMMVPHELNFQTAAPTRMILLAGVPRIFRGAGSKMLSAIIDDSSPLLRKAIMFEDPGPVAPTAFRSLLTVRKYVLRFLALPKIKRETMVHDVPGEEGRRTLRYFDAEPQYVQPTLWNRFGPSACWRRIMSLPLPGDADMFPQGFLMSEVGPKIFASKGEKEMRANEASLSKQRTGGCPFGVAAAAS